MDPLRLLFLSVIALSASIYLLGHQGYYYWNHFTAGGPAFLAPLLFAAIIVPVVLIAKDLADKFGWR